MVAKSGISPSAEIGPTYPTGVAMQPGDLIYTRSTVSTFLVGHIGIVGPDYAVYHSHPYGPGKRDSLQRYINNFASGDPFTVLRVRDGGGLQAGTWAKNNWERLTSYSLNIFTDNIADNYCSKFVWQAYWYGAKKDISDTGMGGAIGKAQFIGPNQINISSKVVRVTSFNR